MARIKAFVRTDIWQDREIKKLTDFQRLIFIYLICNHHLTPLGCYYLPVDYIKADLIRPEKKLIEGLKKVCDVNLAKYCFKTSFVFLPNFLKHNGIRSPKLATAVRKNLEVIPKDFSYFKELIEVLTPFSELIGDGVLESIDTVSKGYRYGAVVYRPNSTSTSNSNSKSKSKTKRDIAQSDKNPSGPSPEIFIKIPLIHKDEDGKSKVAQISKETVKEWQEAYPGLDVEQTLRNIRQWNIANPTKRKTEKGIMRHVTSWLMREQDKGGNKKGGKGNDKEYWPT
jgi:hypothetical protein